MQPGSSARLPRRVLAAFLAEHPEWLAQMVERAAAFDVRAAARLIESFQRFDRRAALPVIRVPTCIVSAEWTR